MNDHNDHPERNNCNGDDVSLEGRSEISYTNLDSDTESYVNTGNYRASIGDNDLERNGMSQQNGNATTEKRGRDNPAFVEENHKSEKLFNSFD